MCAIKPTWWAHCGVCQEGFLFINICTFTWKPKLCYQFSLAFDPLKFFQFERTSPSANESHNRVIKLICMRDKKCKLFSSLKAKLYLQSLLRGLYIKYIWNIQLHREAYKVCVCGLAMSTDWIRLSSSLGGTYSCVDAMMLHLGRATSSYSSSSNPLPSS